MRFNELIAILQDKYEIKLLMADYFPQAIMDIRLLDKKEHHWNEHILFVGSLAQVQNLPDRPIMLLSIDDLPTLPKGSSHARIRNEDMYDLFNTAKDLIFEELREGSMFFELAHMALNGKSIAGVINTAASLLGNALVFVDSSQKVLANSTNYEIVDPLWAQNIERGYCSYEFVQKVRSNSQMKEWSKQGSETRIITLPGDRQPKLVARITQEGHVVGALVMIEHHTPIGRSHLRQLPLIGRLLFDVLNRDSVNGGGHSIYSSFLYGLLDESEISDTIEHAAMSRIEFPAEMRVIVARFVHPIENRFLKRTFCMELERIFPKGHSVQYKSYIGILVPCISLEQWSELAKLPQYEDVSIGLSWPFTDIIEFKRYFNQASASIKHAQHLGMTNQIFDYSDFYYYDLLYNYTGKIPLEHYCHPALHILRQYDKINNTELYVTLNTYLEHKKNLRTTAEALFIHRNTLVYRINRIHQLTELDLGSVNVLYSLMDSFRIETFLRK